MNPRNFFAELKQRKLVQWGVAYVAAAFALLQGIDIVAQQFGWPEGCAAALRSVWSSDFSSRWSWRGIHGERGAQRVTGTELLILALLLALGGGFLWRCSPRFNERAITSTYPLRAAARPSRRCDPGKIHRCPALRKPEQRQGERFFHRWRAG